MLNSIAPTGGTAFYDAFMQTTILALQVHDAIDKQIAQKVITYIIVLTDGEDTSSKLTYQECRQLMAVINKKRNIKMMLVGIALNGDGYSKLKGLGDVGDDDIAFINLQHDSQMAGFFEHVGIALKARVVTQTHLAAFNVNQ